MSKEKEQAANAHNNMNETKNAESRPLRSTWIPNNARAGDRPRHYWLVGYTYSGAGSQLDNFLKGGYWEGQFDAYSSGDQSMLKLAGRIGVGDVLILKSSSTKGKNHDQPFMRVRTVGVVWRDIRTETADGRTVCRCQVDYAPLCDKDFNGSRYGSYRKTIHEVDEERLGEIVDYANENLKDTPMRANKYDEIIALLKANHNLVLTGAPGTGKTYMARTIAKEMGCGEDEVQFVQFHPSYDYTDFVEGLRPINEGDGQVGFERRDGVFKAFCKRAWQNILDSRNGVADKGKDPSPCVQPGKVKSKNFVFIIDEINRGEASKIFGELFYAIDPGYRGDTEMRVKTQYQNMIPETDVFYKGFFVPDNVYIIGTMNDIDRSVESMDFAMRRRFTWKEVSPADNEDMLYDLEYTLRDEAIKRMRRLNKCIAKTDGLGAAYRIGPAYFLKLEKYHGNFDELWTWHIEPLLREYLRGTRKLEETLAKFKAAYYGTAVQPDEEFEDVVHID